MIIIIITNRVCFIIHVSSRGETDEKLNVVGSFALAYVLFIHTITDDSCFLSCADCSAKSILKTMFKYMNINSLPFSLQRSLLKILQYVACERVSSNQIQFYSASRALSEFNFRLNREQCVCIGWVMRVCFDHAPWLLNEIYFRVLAFSITGKDSPTLYSIFKNRPRTEAVVSSLTFYWHPTHSDQPVG